MQSGGTQPTVSGRGKRQVANTEAQYPCSIAQPSVLHVLLAAALCSRDRRSRCHTRTVPSADAVTTTHPRRCCLDTAPPAPLSLSLQLAPYMPSAGAVAESSTSTA